jgi:hypothetical protein
MAIVDCNGIGERPEQWYVDGDRTAEARDGRADRDKCADVLCSVFCQRFDNGNIDDQQ